MVSTIRPTSLSLVCYQVGFGDCFLLSFHYKKGDKHVLIDFGSTGRPGDAPKDLLKRVAADVQTRTHGKLTAIVETHRHADHITGFATTKNGTGPGDVIASLHPDLVVQPWTEDPDAKPDAKHATTTVGTKGFVAALDAMNTMAASIPGQLKHLRQSISPLTAAQLSFFGSKNLKNRSAVENLMRMGKRHAYVNHGSRSGLETLLPGVKVTVLGPPTLDQSRKITKERAEDASEFWQLEAATTTRFTPDGSNPLPRSKITRGTDATVDTRWFRQAVQSVHADALLELVRSLDKQMNNTSVILLFQSGGQALLFPGDAQIENWEYALEQKDIAKLLGGVTLYKVGHHGSRNATPKSMWKLLLKKGGSRSKRLRSVVSTMSGKFGSVDSGTEVPRHLLVKELQKNSELFTTQSLRGQNLHKVFEIPLTGRR